MTSVVIHPVQQLRGIVNIPGDKSISHRGIIFGAISQGRTIISHFLYSADCLNTIHAFKVMGVKISTFKNLMIIVSRGIDQLKVPKNPLDMGNSGTTTRLITGLLAGRPFNSELIGDASLSKRPMRRITIPLSKMGAQIRSTPQGTLPLKIKGQTQLKGINYTMPVASAQVKSSIILAAIQAQSSSKIVEPIYSRDHTERMLAKFSPRSIKRSGHQIMIKPRQQFSGQNVDVPGDISSAAFFIVAAAIVPNSKVCLKNVGINSTRTGLLKVMQRMGANIRLVNLKDGAEPAADIIIRSSKLRPVQVTKAEIPSLIDEVPLVALLAARANGVSKITGAQELRFKESNRLATTTEELQKLGVDIKQLPDGFIINGHQTWQPRTYQLESHNDHRIAMMLAVAALLIHHPVTIHHANCIRISYPEFFNDLKRLE